MTAFVALTDSGAETARRLKSDFPGGIVYGRTGRVEDADRFFDDTIAVLRDLFVEGTPIVGICASGILIRAVAPLIADKWAEPPVIAVSEDGSAVVPLLGGHHGANAMARTIAARLDGQAAVTTAGDIRLGIALDDPPPGWTVSNPSAVKSMTASLLAGRPVSLEVEVGDADWLASVAVSNDANANRILVTDRSGAFPEGTLVYHPPVLAVGIGAERDVPAEEGAAAVKSVMDSHGLAAASVSAIGSIDIKADEPAVLSAAEMLNLDARFFTADQLNAEKDRLQNPSEIVFKETGCHGVSEGAALALAGSSGSLIVPKTRVGRVTVAIARADRVPDASAGRTGGRLDVVGVGPGQQAWRTGEAVAALKQADEIVGYGLYLDLIADLIGGKPKHPSPLGDETGRVDHALQLAAQGKRIALVCSGDPGIFALATLVFERVEQSQDRAVRGVRTTILPGISAFQAASARLGAPMGHDFCLISLSDLLTPREAIRKRIKAAAEGDFVIAFYNPQSLRRRTLLGEACETLASFRPPETPVAVGRNLGRPDESMTITPLSEFDPASVDMLSIVIIGNSESRTLSLPFGDRVYTPRGYAQKQEPAIGEKKEVRA